MIFDRSSVTVMGSHQLEIDNDAKPANVGSSESFRAFMTLVAEFEELSAVGSRFLRGYKQELEIFRRPPLHKTSKMVERIIETNKTERMKAYLDSGCGLTHNSLQNTEKLFSCQLRLRTHIEKVKRLMNQLEGASEDAIGIFQDATDSWNLPTSTAIDDKLEKLKFSAVQEGALEDSFSPEEDEFVHDSVEEIFGFSIATRVIYNMLKSEFTMQDKVVRSLNLNSSSDELESYCMLWELRPYIDDQIIRQSWALIK